MKKFIKISIIILIFSTGIFAQNSFTLQGYVSALRNKGFIANAGVVITNKLTDEIVANLKTDNYGAFTVELNDNNVYSVTVSKEIYFDIEKTIDGSTKNENNKIFIKFQMKRKPGYIFEISLTDIRLSPYAPVDGITDALIEVYNNTEEKAITSFKNKMPNFKINLNKGNHYTILIRKKGYMAKQLEAYLNVNGCIICFDGVSQMRPGVKADLYDNNTVGKYVATIEMDKVFKGKKFKINNIYYDLNKWDIKPKAAKELNNLAKILKLNPNLFVELGSHTDCRGSDSYNLSLSSKRAKAAVDYLVLKKGIKQNRITHKGYGERELTNKCDDGVKCTEEQHALNRRTEVKILNILENENSEFIPLETIKNQDLFEKKIQDMMTSKSEIIQFKDGELPEEIRRDIEKQRKEKTKGNIKSTKEVKKTIKSKRKLNKSKEMVIPKQEESKSPTTKELKKKTKSLQKKDNTSIKNFTGYKIVILFTRYPLPKGHIIYKNITNIEEYEIKDEGYVLYLTGSYDTYQEAKDDLDTNWIKKYRRAYIAKFKDGVKVKIED